MSANLQVSSKQDIKGLVTACSNNQGEDAFSQSMTPSHWATLAPFLQYFTLGQGQILISQGALDRTLYFVEAGSLSVHFQDADDRVRLAIVGAGAALGEGGFFTHLPRNATVQAATDCKLWSLTPLRFAELSNRQPACALALTLALGALVSKRMLSSRKRIAVT
jgi:CRP/FNR family transcriptional regulator, cyclic AMP receptor protein